VVKLGIELLHDLGIAGAGFGENRIDQFGDFVGQSFAAEAVGQGRAGFGGRGGFAVTAFFARGSGFFLDGPGLVDFFCQVLRFFDDLLGCCGRRGFRGG